jgi:4-aminobutyrate aminotransferase/(S)-3-amino-2-methylpropionate transaminase
LSEEEFVGQALHRVHDAFKNQVAPEAVAAVIIELVQGEGGFNIAPLKFIQGLRKICADQKIILIIDEVQSGFCRTGKWAAYHHYGITPDISTWAKSLGSGMPIGAVIGKQEIMDAAIPGTIGGTYLGNPVCCAAAIATIDYMEFRDLNTRAQQISRIVHARFTQMKEHCPSIGDIRGLGAMQTIEFVLNGDPHQPDNAICERMASACLERGLILLTAGTYKNVIRILTPLMIADDLLNQGLDIIERELKKL